MGTQTGHKRASLACHESQASNAATRLVAGGDGRYPSKAGHGENRLQRRSGPGDGLSTATNRVRAANRGVGPHSRSEAAPRRSRKNLDTPGSQDGLTIGTTMSCDLLGQSYDIPCCESQIVCPNAVLLVPMALTLIRRASACGRDQRREQPPSAPTCRSWANSPAARSSPRSYG